MTNYHNFKKIASNNSLHVYKFSTNNKLMAAGCVFMNGTHILAGAQIKKGITIISGFGGSREDNETTIHNAFRETLEEIFNYYTTDTSVTEYLIANYQPIKEYYVVDINYTFYVFSFEQLESILKYLQTVITSNLYYHMPTTIYELITNRRLIVGSEISHLCILPLVKGISLDKYFIADISLLID